MFIAMNRFRVARGSEAAFEQVWLSRDSHLEKVPGFVAQDDVRAVAPGVQDFRGWNARWVTGEMVAVLRS